MEIKLFEVRDRMTTMPVLAVKLTTQDDREAWLLSRAGYSQEQTVVPEGDASVEPYVLLVKLDGVEAQYDPSSWASRRSLPTVHRWLIEHWHEAKPGSVLDVEYLLGETSTPAVSEQLIHYGG